jgi:hypothetical protein
MQVYIIDALVGRTPVDVVQTEGAGKDDEMHFLFEDGSKIIFWHAQECCEDVHIEDIVGDLSDLVGWPILVAEEVSTSEGGTLGNTLTWTFYKFATQSGFVTVRWVGESNGYYSESVDITEVDPAGKQRHLRRPS